MSTFREQLEPPKSVKQYVTACLEQLARSRLLESSDELVDYLLEEVKDDRPSFDWINSAPNPALRELLKEHRRKFHLFSARAGQAPLAPGAPGPVQRFAPHHDSTYFSSDPGSPMSEISQPRAQESDLNVFLVSAATPDDEPFPALARINPESDTNIIDYETAVSLFGGRIKDGQGVRIGCRNTHDDLDGRSTTQMQCIVGQVQHVNIMFARDYGRLKTPLESPSGSVRGSSSFDRVEFERRRARHMTLMAEALAEEEMLRERKRPARG